MVDNSGRGLAIADWKKEAGLESGDGQNGRDWGRSGSWGVGAELMQLAPGTIPFGHGQILYASIVIVMAWSTGLQVARRICKQ